MTTNNAIVCANMRTTGTTYTTTRRDGSSYTVKATPYGYILDGVTFATLDGALTTARREHERRTLSESR